MLCQPVPWGSRKDTHVPGTRRMRASLRNLIRLPHRTSTERVGPTSADARNRLPKQA
jgi:hypothetical protein